MFVCIFWQKSMTWQNLIMKKTITKNIKIQPFVCKTDKKNIKL